MRKKIWLSPPYQSGLEKEFVAAALTSNWISTTGPQVEEFEDRFRMLTGKKYALAVNSGTSALHLALLSAGIKAGDEVICPAFTFAASAFPILYCKANPVFADSEAKTWNMDLEILPVILEKRKKVKAVIGVNIYGNPAESFKMKEIADKYKISFIEDAAESVGSKFCKKHTGTLSDAGIYSFNGNKIITTSAGGLLITDNESIYRKARLLANQGAEKAHYYDHREIGYNYRMTNIAAAIGLAQIETLEDRVNKRREIFNIYKAGLEDLEIEFQSELNEGFSNRWLTCILFPDGKIRNKAFEVLRNNEVESRLLMKPMQLQPVFHTAPFYGNGVSVNLYERGLCLPSGYGLTEEDICFIISKIRGCF